MKIRWLISLLSILFFLGEAEAKVENSPEIWMVRQDFVKFGKKEAYEVAKKEYFQEFVRYVKRRDAFPSYALQVLDSPQYLYLIPVGSYRGVDLLMKQKEGFMNSYTPQDWDVRMLARASTINFFFKSLQQFLPDSSCIPQGKEQLASFPYFHVYWIGITPGQEDPFEQHMQQMAELQLTEEDPICWRVWRETVGYALPQYFIAVCGRTEEEAEAHAEQLEFVSGPYKHIVRKQTQAQAVLRLDLSMLP